MGVYSKVSNLFTLYLIYNLILIESAVHNNVTHECNRHRLNGYKDKTWIDRVPNDCIFDYERKRNFD